MAEFSYDAAFTRNIGWLTEWEQDALRGKRVAIAGLGGVGGAHLLTLARLGVGAFNIADFDRFDWANFNRQVGATTSSVGRPKLDVMAEMALSINPELQIGRFAQGVTAENVDSFLQEVDLFVDGFDFFVLGIRRLVFRRCAELGIPAITAAPIGMGTNWLIFLPGGMTFEQYFRLDGQSETEQYLRFLMGLAPAGEHRRYLVDPTRVDLQRKTGPSTSPSCQLCAGVVGVEAVKLLLGRNNVWAAPLHHHFDPYAGTFRRTRLRWGMAGPVQSAKLALARRFYLRQLGIAAPRPAESAPQTPVERVLHLARWAPSGDNVQPWRFKITGDETLTIHFRPDDSGNPYEYRGGEPSLLALGMLLETMRLAASRFGRALHYEILPDCEPIKIAVRMQAEAGLRPDPLAAFIAARSVHRRAMLTRPLSPAEKASLQDAAGSALRLHWFESVRERWRIARLGARVTDIRLRTPEIFPVHQRVVDWTNRHSATGLPAGAIGLDRATLRIMRWAMQDWRRMHRMNQAVGTLTAAAQLDLLPGLASAAYFGVQPVGASPQGDPAALVRAGAALQRFWLTATQLGLALQPASALLMMAHYGEADAHFTSNARLRQKTRRIARSFTGIFGAEADSFLFLGRIGQPRPRLPSARSVRRPVADLLMDDDGEKATAG